MNAFTPGLVLKEWVYSNGKTVESVRASKSFSPFEHIIIFNQPTGYQHIYIATVNDLINLIWDIFDYNLYYKLYDTYVELYELYKVTLENLNNHKYSELFPKAHNLLASPSRWKNFKTRLNIWTGKQITCNLNKEQLILMIPEIERYFKERKKYTDIYWEDLLLWYTNFLCLDEIHNYFDSRSWSTNFWGKNAVLRPFISFPVKLGTRIEWITQSVDTLDVNFRRQTSLYKRHTTRLFGLLQKSQEYAVKDTEKPRFDDSEITSSSTSINWYQISKWRIKVQYYREFLPTSMDHDVYRKWMYFQHIRYMTDAWNELYPSEELKEVKELKE